MSAALSDFQVEVWSKLRTSLNDTPVQVSSEVVQGRTEDYVKVSVGTDLTFWLYRNGAGILGPRIDDRFEWQDFESLDELGIAFLLRAKRVLEDSVQK